MILKLTAFIKAQVQNNKKDIHFAGENKFPQVECNFCFYKILDSLDFEKKYPTE